MTLRRLVWLLLLIAIPAVLSFAPPIRLRLNNNSDWILALGVADITGLAGTDFATDIESDPAAQEIWLQNTTGNWRVDVSRADTTWHSGIRIYLRRTSDGTGGTAISGGTVYQELTTADATFFTGTGDPKDVSEIWRPRHSRQSAGRGV